MALAMAALSSIHTLPAEWEHSATSPVRIIKSLALLYTNIIISLSRVLDTGNISHTLSDNKFISLHSKDKQGLVVFQMYAK